MTSTPPYLKRATERGKADWLSPYSLEIKWLSVICLIYWANIPLLRS